MEIVATVQTNHNLNVLHVYSEKILHTNLLYALLLHEHMESVAGAILSF